MRMTGRERREQLIDVGRLLFAEKGFEAVSVEEIAAKAEVSKPVVYEHFGGKEGLYAVVVDREMNRLLTMISSALRGSHPRKLLEQAGMALFDYIDENRIQPFLAAEVLVDDGLGHAGFRRDLLDTDRLEAFVREEGTSDIEELLATLLAGHAHLGTLARGGAIAALRSRRSRLSRRRSPRRRTQFDDGAV